MSPCIILNWWCSMSRNRVVESIIRNPWIFTTKSLGTAKHSNEKDRWDMSFNNIFPGIITVWMQAWLKHLTLLIVCSVLLYGNRIILHLGPVVFFFFLRTAFISLSGRDAKMAYWYNIWQLVIIYSALKPGIFHSNFFQYLFKSILKIRETMLLNIK